MYVHVGKTTLIAHFSPTIWALSNKNLTVIAIVYNSHQCLPISWRGRIHSQRTTD